MNLLRGFFGLRREMSLQFLEEFSRKSEFRSRIPFGFWDFWEKYYRTSSPGEQRHLQEEWNKTKLVDFATIYLLFQSIQAAATQDRFRLKTVGEIPIPTADVRAARQLLNILYFNNDLLLVNQPLPASPPVEIMFFIPALDFAALEARHCRSLLPLIDMYARHAGWCVTVQNRQMAPCATLCLRVASREEFDAVTATVGHQVVRSSGPEECIVSGQISRGMAVVSNLACSYIVFAANIWLLDAGTHGRTEFCVTVPAPDRRNVKPGVFDERGQVPEDL